MSTQRQYRKGKWIKADPTARNFKGRYPARAAVMGHLGPFYVTTYHLREVLLPLIDREARELCEDGDYTCWGANRNQQLIAERVATITKMKVDSCMRRIFDILYSNDQPRDNVNADFAEAIFIACGERMEDYEVPRLPASKEGAWEMAHVWADSHEDVPALAHALMRFSIGYSKADEIIDPEQAERVKVRRNASRNKRNDRRREQSAAA